MEELTEGYHFCPRCNRKTMHELQPVEVPHYETASDEEIVELEANTILNCVSCSDREEAAYREEVYGEIEADPYGYITPALDEDEEDDSGLSGEFEEEDDADDTIYQFALAASSAEKIANGEFEDGDIYHGCDGDDFDPYLDVETFRDRRLDQ